MKNKIFLFIIMLCLGFMISCDNLLLGDITADTPISNFENLWEEFNEKYGLFHVKGIDWDSVYSTFRPQISQDSTEEELYTVLTDMLGLLNDCHVGLLPTSGSGLPSFQSGILGTIDTMDDFSLDVVKTFYLTDHRFADPFFTYGILDGTDSIGYVHIEGFSDLPKNLEGPMDEVLSFLSSTNGLIIDVRGGYGGEDLAGQYIAGRFAGEAAVYMKSRVKSGPGENDFTPFATWAVKPEGDFQYDKPLVILTHRFTISARETFCLAMKALPQATFIGDTTAGAFSNQINRELPNGWAYSLSIGQWLDADGISYEGVGLVPDFVVLNDRDDLLAGQDEALETAIQELE